MKPIFCNQEMGDTERLLCPGAPQGPARYQQYRISGWGIFTGRGWTREPLIVIV